MPKPIAKNTLFYGDNLPILREYLLDESVDLVYLDPPFNSQRVYNVSLKDQHGKESEAQIEAFKDFWTWDEEAAEAHEDLMSVAPASVIQLMTTLKGVVGETSSMRAYLTMMIARLLELRRVLKPTGSLYLHCDPTASHYLKIVLDTIFGVDNYQNEIIWKRTTAHNDPRRWGNVHDSIFFYSKSPKFTWNLIYLEHDEEYKKRFRHSDPNGRLWTDGNLTAKGLSGGGYEYEYKGAKSLWRVPLETMKRLDAEGRLHFTKTGGIRSKDYLDESPGKPVQDVISDISPINSQAQERLGYPTQKPLTLLERIIQASSNEGDVVLDPFCGCGTAVVAAQKLNRKWIGIDITHLSIALMKYRLQGSFNIQAGRDYEVIGEPQDLDSAKQLARDDRYQFQFWALSLIEAKPLGGEQGSRKGKKGADKGVDGLLPFLDSKDTTKIAVVQVKSGHVQDSHIRDLIGVLQNEDSPMGLFITLEEPTRNMIQTAAAAGIYESKSWGKFPRIQILTIEDLLSGKKPQTPPIYGAFKQAGRIPKKDAKQIDWGL